MMCMNTTVQILYGHLHKTWVTVHVDNRATHQATEFSTTITEPVGGNSLNYPVK